jgi:hypothetical protein
MAIGLGRPGDPCFLVYLSVQPGSREVFAECEIPAYDTAGVPYDVVGSGSYADYHEVFVIVRDHLSRLLAGAPPKQTRCQATRGNTALYLRHER